jgi:two-component system sensor histidine kinase UhpB
MGDVRSLAHQLRPSELDELGLVASLRSHFDKVVRPLGLAVQFHENLGEDRLQAALELCCFRVVQEALTNCVRHAQAKAVSVMLERTPGVLKLQVRDDGIGFDKLRQGLPGDGGSNSLGLLGIRERVAAIGGQLQIHAVPGQGTGILVSFALEETPS